MTIEGLIANVTSVRSTDRAERVFFWWFWAFLVNSGRFCGRKATLWSENSLLDLKPLLRVIWWRWSSWLPMKHLSGPLPEQNMIFWEWSWTHIFWSIQATFVVEEPLYQATFVVEEPLCDVGITPWALIPLIRAIQRGVDCRCNICRVPCQSETWCFGDDFGHFLANSGCFCGQGATLWSRNPLLNSNTFTWVHSMSIDGFIVNVTSVSSTNREERDFFGWFWAFFGQFRRLLWSGNHFVFWEFPLGAKTFT